MPDQLYTPLKKLSCFPNKLLIFIMVVFCVNETEQCVYKQMDNVIVFSYHNPPLQGVDLSKHTHIQLKYFTTAMF